MKTKHKVTGRQKSRNQRVVQQLSPTARYKRSDAFIPISTVSNNYDHLTEEEKEIEKKRNHELKMATDKKNSQFKKKAIKKRKKS